MKRTLIKIIKNLISLDNINLLPLKLIRRIKKFGNSALCYLCGKQLTLEQISIGRAFCSQLCSKHSKIRLKHRTNTNREKYGCKTCMQLPLFVLKMKQTNLLKYGVLMPIQNLLIKLKILQTNLLRYGSKYASQSKEIKNKISNSIKTNLVQAKMKKACLLRFGVDHPSKSKLILLAKRKTCLSRYGVISPAAKNVWKRIESWKTHILPLFNKDQYYTYDTVYKWKCVKCGNLFLSAIYSTYFCLLDRYMPRCLKCYPKTKGISNPLLEVKDFCKKYFKIKSNDKKIIKPYLLDIVIPLIKLAILFNGIYWHSLLAGCEQNYHLRKTQMCLLKGYRLIHIWLDLWNDNKELIKQKLINIFLNRLIIDENLILDRCWYSTLQFLNYLILLPLIITKNSFQIENCGYLKNTKINK